MKTLIKRSATLAACATLLIAGTAAQASAGDRDDPTRGSVANNGGTSITVTGDNNNTAGNDLIIGNNNTSGTGHTVGDSNGNGNGVGDQYIQFAVANHTSRTLTIDSAADCDNCVVNSTTQSFPIVMSPGINSVVFPYANLPFASSRAELDLHYTMPDGSGRIIRAVMTTGGGSSITCTSTAEVLCNPVDSTTLELLDR
ncbi:hypothetical protein ACFV16_33945 [Streptomyces massasporeus]|uniref:hypothetical protein n=1 Tax=Streptomyces massasporeus TaxID=67324 RepID=UPI0036886496